MNRYETLVPNIDLPDFRDPAVPIEEAFTWEEGLAETEAESLYVVRFCSQRDPVLSADVVEKLIVNDRAAYAEAQHAFPDDFLLYCCDEKSPGGKSLSMCLWTSPQYARAALQLPSHQEAVSFMNESGVYESYDVSGYVLRKSGVQLSFEEVYKKSALKAA
jgi:hypothetical protein